MLPFARGFDTSVKFKHHEICAASCFVFVFVFVVVVVVYVSLTLTKKLKDKSEIYSKLEWVQFQGISIRVDH